MWLDTYDEVERNLAGDQLFLEIDKKSFFYKNTATWKQFGSEATEGQYLEAPRNFWANLLPYFL